MSSSNTCRKRRPLRVRRLRRLLAVFAAAFLLAGAAHAMDPNRAMSQYIRERWGPERGFPRGPVYAIAQTADGYLWIGAEAGLVRFDGLNFRLVKDTSTTPLSIRHVLGLTADHDGNLWLRLRGATVLRYRNGEFTDVTGELSRPASVISAMGRSAAGELLLSGVDGGAMRYRGGKFERLTSEAGGSRSAVISMAETSGGDVWLGTRDAGLIRLRDRRAVAVTGGLPDLKVNCLLPGGDGEMWVGTDSGVVRWNGAEFSKSGLPASLDHVQALAMTRDRDSNVWIGTNAQGLLRLNARGVSTLFMGDHGPPAAVTAVFEDREGNIWTGSANGIERFRDSVFVTYSMAEGLPSDENGPVYVDADGRAWFAPADGGLYSMREGRTSQVTAAGLGRDVVYSIAGDAHGVWIGRQRGGLTRLRSREGAVTAETYTKANGLAQNSVYTVYESRDGAVWAGTLSGGVSRFRDGKFTTYTIAKGLPSNTVSAILETRDGTMWFGTPNGLSALANGRWRGYAARDGLPSSNINCLWEDSTGSLWIGTTDGLAALDSGGVRLPLGVPAALKESIVGITEDTKGWLWVATANHILRVNREKLLSSALDGGDVREFEIADGLHGTEGVKRHRSLTTDGLGRVWISLNRGISVVDPTRLTGISAPSIVNIEGITADGRAIDTRGAVRIPASSKRVAFLFTGLNLSVPDRIRFRYTLDGFDHGWSEGGANREAVYTNLGPGPYRFRAIASNTEGIWNSAEAAVVFEIEPAFWQTWYFRLSVLLVCTGAGFAVHRFRLRQLTRRLNVRFEERMGERLRIAQELHDTLLQGLLSASMLLHVADEQLPASAPSKPAVGRVLKLMAQVLEDGRNAVGGLRRSSRASQDLGQAFSNVRNEIAATGQADFSVIVQGEPRPLHPALREEVYRVGREALVNAFRHSGASRVEVELEYAASRLRVLVRDNGCGIDPEVLRTGREGHWGLAGMRERAERIGARLAVWSSVGAGTEIELSVPGHIAFQTSGSARLSRWFTSWRRRRTPDETSEPVNHTK